MATSKDSHLVKQIKELEKRDKQVNKYIQKNSFFTPLPPLLELTNNAMQKIEEITDEYFEEYKKISHNLDMEAMVDDE